MTTAPALAASATVGAKLKRVWMALVSPLILMPVVFMGFGTYFAVRHGLRGEAIGKAMEGLAFYPALIVFGLVFAVTAWFARRDGLSLKDLGWRRPSMVDLGIGLAVALLCAAANHFALHPLIRSVTPTFDPTLSMLGPIELVLLQAVGVAAEDTLYRGYALTRLSERFSWPIALVLSALFYAALSAGQGWAMVVWAILFGILLGVLFRWRGNLWPVAVAHYVLALVPRLVAAVQS